MTCLQMTRHADQRMRQRGLSAEDIELVYRFGTQTAAGILLRRKDVANFERCIKRTISRLERLEGTLVVNDGDVIMTSYHTTTRRQKRLMRRPV